MLIKGKYTTAQVYTTKNVETAIEDYAASQIQALCDQPINEGCQIAVMPDVHAGIVGTIGYTQTVGKAIIPNVVGIDIGCGMTLARVKGRIKDFQKLDTVIREKVPAGFAIRDDALRMADEIDLSEMHCYKNIQADKAYRSIGTLGGGNHFIEVDQGEDGDFYLVIHSGSRHLGIEVTNFYINQGEKVLKEKGCSVPHETTYLEGQLMQEYLEDLQIVQKYADINRQAILAEVIKGMKWKVQDTYSCIHNYVESADTTFTGTPIIRKGAISAKAGEKVIIPVNMQAGIILGTGLGNDAWNQSAPHGAGRLYKRSAVKEHFTVSQFKKAMQGIYSTCIDEGTLDEAPFAYRCMDDILEVIGETVCVDQIIRPIYNFKAGRKKKRNTLKDEK